MFDPEIPVNIYELGLIYDVVVDADGVVGDPDDADRAGLPGRAVAAGRGRATKVEERPGVTDAKVDVVWEPPWTKDRMSDAAKLQLGMW